MAEKLKKALIITYYWPPAGGGGVQRWLKFTKYMRDYGWEPVIYTPENAETALEDPSLKYELPDGLTELKQPIWEPYDFYKEFLGKKKSEKIYSGFIQEGSRPSFKQKFAVWIRGNFFIPDARKFWIKPSVRFLKKYLKKNPVDAIISTGPPHSMHMIALGIKKELSLPWIADFRDPWTQIDFYDQLMLTSWADKKHKKLEKKVLKSADKVVTVTWSWAQELEGISEREVQVITNGYDEEDFKQSKTGQLDDEFSITHLGSMNQDRNPNALWEVLHELKDETEDFKNDLKIRLIGPTDFQVVHDLENNNLQDQTEHIPLLAHSEGINQICRSQVLLLPLNNTPNISGIVPGKLYEYIAAKRPILCIGSSKGDSAKIITETNAGYVADFNDKQKIRKVILQYYQKYKNKDLTIESRNIEQFSRKKLTAKMAGLMQSLIS